jgi:flagellar basal body-associated protein FliL
LTPEIDAAQVFSLEKVRSGGIPVRGFLVRLLIAAAMTLVAFALASSAHAQQADEDPSPATPRQPPDQAPHAAQPNNAQAAAPSGPQTEDALAFTGRLVKQKGQIVLNDPVTKISYQLDDPLKAKKYTGRRVKVIGKLDLNSNTIHIDSIEPLS